jgi:hypothetical protein
MIAGSAHLAISKTSKNDRARTHTRWRDQWIMALNPDSWSVYGISKRLGETLCEAATQRCAEMGICIAASDACDHRGGLPSPPKAMGKG